MRKYLLAIVSSLFLAACGGSGVQSTEASGSTAVDSAKRVSRNASYLFVQEATRGAFKPANDSSPAQLVLWGGKGLTTWFTDRPVRDAGVMHTDLFVASWSRGKDSFKADPPNAALVVQDSAGQSQAYAMEILASVYEPISKTVAYQVRPLASGVPVTGHTKNARALSEVPARFGDAALFIDPSESWCMFAYQESCEQAVCDPLKPLAYNKAQCNAQQNPAVPQNPPVTPPPQCSDGSFATWSSGNWKCTPPATVLNCGVGRAPVPYSFSPPFWLCEADFAVHGPTGFSAKAKRP